MLFGGLSLSVQPFCLGNNLLSALLFLALLIPRLTHPSRKPVSNKRQPPALMRIPHCGPYGQDKLTRSLTLRKETASSLTESPVMDKVWHISELCQNLVLGL
jgi:hypothetical protein